jgi:hypothetical protein
MSSVARRGACKAPWFLSLIAGVSVLPASAGQNFGVTLVPAITTLTGNGSRLAMERGRLHIKALEFPSPPAPVIGNSNRYITSFWKPKVIAGREACCL